MQPFSKKMCNSACDQQCKRKLQIIEEDNNLNLAWELTNIISWKKVSQQWPLTSQYVQTKSNTTKH